MVLAANTANAVFGKIGGRASEEVIIQIIRTKCMPVLLYGLDFRSMSIT